MFYLYNHTLNIDVVVGCLVCMIPMNHHGSQINQGLILLRSEDEVLPDATVLKASESQFHERITLEVNTSHIANFFVQVCLY